SAPKPRTTSLLCTCQYLPARVQPQPQCWHMRLQNLRTKNREFRSAKCAARGGGFCSSQGRRCCALVLPTWRRLCAFFTAALHGCVWEAIRLFGAELAAELERRALSLRLQCFVAGLEFGQGFDQGL
ncbi:hypothetical protein MC885_017353, partial [Smutsia gigantea]